MSEAHHSAASCSWRFEIIISVLKICTDIETCRPSYQYREVTLRIGDSPLIKPLEDIPKMADAVQLMVRESLEAFVSRDECKAREVCLSDDAVDRMYSDLHDELMGYMTSSHDPRCVEQAANLLFVARQLERMRTMRPISASRHLHGYGQAG